MTDEEIREIEEVVKRSKYCNKFYKENNCNNRCPLRFKNEPYDLGFLDGFKAAYNEIKIDVNKLTIGDVRCAIKQSPQYAELLLRSIGWELKDVIINSDKHNDNN